MYKQWALLTSWLLLIGFAASTSAQESEGKAWLNNLTDQEIEHGLEMMSTSDELQPVTLTCMMEGMYLDGSRTVDPDEEVVMVTKVLPLNNQPEYKKVTIQSHEKLYDAELVSTGNNNLFVTYTSVLNDKEGQMPAFMIGYNINLKTKKYKRTTMIYGGETTEHYEGICH